LYYTKFEDGGLWSLNIVNGKEHHISELPHLGDWGQLAVTQDGIYMMDSTAEVGPTIMYYDIKTKRTTPILVLKQRTPQWSSSLAASRDGRILVYVQIESKGSILMAEKTQ
jgi:hypothetical protein